MADHRSASSSRKDLSDLDSGEDFELSDEVLREMQLIGKDLVSASTLNRVYAAPVKEDIENMLNETEDPVILAIANHTTNVAELPMAVHHSENVNNDLGGKYI